jgi:hypothetical protein
MIKYFVGALLCILYINLSAQIKEDSVKAMNSIFEPKLENYNYSDTLQNSFARYLVNSEFRNYHVGLIELNEKSLISEIKNGKHLFRILSLPSFNHPICFSISSIKENYYLNWAVGRGRGCYEPKGVMKKGKVKISDRDWKYFLRLIDISSLDTLPLVSYFPMNDGTSWVVEKNIDNLYKIHFTNDPQTRIEDAFALFSHISDIKNKEVINFYGPYEFRYFNKNNTKIDLDSIRNTVITHLNKNFNDKFSDNKYLFNDGIYIKINSKGRIKSVKYIPYTLPHLTFEDKLDYITANYQDRRLRNSLKNSFKKLNLNNLNLSQSIWIPVYMKFNNDRKILELGNN